MWRAPLLVVVALGGPVVGAEQTSFPQTGPALGDGAAVQRPLFEFEPGPCGMDNGGIACSIMQPIPWSDSDTALVNRALDEIARHPTGLLILDRAQSEGYRTFRRFRFNVDRNELRKPISVEDVNLAANPPALSPKGIQRLTSVTTRGQATRTNGVGIDLFDAGFACAEARDRWSGIPGYSVFTKLVLHELMHAVDSLGADLFRQRGIQTCNRAKADSRRPVALSGDGGADRGLRGLREAATGPAAVRGRLGNRSPLRPDCSEKAAVDVVRAQSRGCVRGDWRASALGPERS